MVPIPVDDVALEIPEMLENDVSSIADDEEEEEEATVVTGAAFFELSSMALFSLRYAFNASTASLHRCFPSRREGSACDGIYG